MGAGVPNFQRLAEMGKLPKSQEKNLPGLAGMNTAVAELNRLREGMCEDCHEKFYPGKTAGRDEVTQLRCDVEGCGHMVGGKSESKAKENLEKHKKAKHN
jgi:hypothetical protein